LICERQFATQFDACHDWSPLEVLTAIFKTSASRTSLCPYIDRLEKELERIEQCPATVALIAACRFISAMWADTFDVPVREEAAVQQRAHAHTGSTNESSS